MAEDSINNDKHFVLQKIFVKDVSFETPNSPHIFTEKWDPKVEFNLASKVQILQENLYESTLTVTVTVNLGEKNAYLVEVAQAGIFSLSGFTENEQGAVLGAYCPNVLFPYAREAVSDLVTKGGFPPLLLAPVNFDVLYAQQLQQQQGNSGQTH